MCPACAPLDVTVVTPTFNRAKLIARALESVRRQQRPPARIIVVDDASTDGTPAVVRGWTAETCFPVTVEVMAQNGGPAKARNRGIELATTKYVSFLDSDDEHLPDTLERLCAPLDEIESAVLSFADATIVTPSSSEPHGLFRPHIDLDATTERVSIAFPHEVRSLCDATTTLLKASIIPTSATCFRRRSALAAGLMPDDFRSGEDWLFWLRLAGQGRFVFQSDDLARHHRHDDNLTHGRAAELMAREKLRGFLGLLDGSLGLALPPEQTKRATKLCAERLANWHYHLSRLGLTAYLDGLDADWARPLGSRTAQLMRDPRSVLRAMYYSFAS